MMQTSHAMRMPIAALLIGSSLAAPARAQDQSAATPADTIFARKTVMDTISEKMDALEAASIADRKIDLNAAHEQADVLSVLLLAFPHMFPVATNQWKPDIDKDPAVDTYAAPELWAKFSDFYRRATPPRSPTMQAVPAARRNSRPRSRSCAALATAATPSTRGSIERRAVRSCLASFGRRWPATVDDAKTSRASCT
jgi:hypothetical protein